MFPPIEAKRARTNQVPPECPFGGTGNSDASGTSFFSGVAGTDLGGVFSGCTMVAAAAFKTLGCSAGGTLFSELVRRGGHSP